MSGSLNTAAIPAVIGKQTGLSLRFAIDSEDNPLCGGEYLVYTLEDESCARKLAFRVPRTPYGPHTGVQVEKEAEIRRRIDATGVGLFQQLMAADPTIDNVLGAPYLVLGWADGRPLKWTDTIPADRRAREAVLYAVANASIDLLRVCETGVTAHDWITRKIDRKISRAQAGTFRGTVQECQDQKDLITKYWMPELDTSPHVLVHNDLSGNNIIVDDDSNVQGIIDLGWAEMQPLQFAAEYPRFLTYEPLQDATGAFEWTQRDTIQLRRDRAFYLECVRLRAEKETGTASDYYRVLARKDEVKRFWWYTAASRIDVHQAMAACAWDPPVE